MKHIIIRILCLYHDKDIDFNTGSVLQSYVSHMTMWCISLPFSKMVECNNTTFQIGYLGDKWSDVYRVKVKSCPTPWDHMDCSLLGSSIHGIFLGRILERIAIYLPGDLPVSTMTAISIDVAIPLIPSQRISRKEVEGGLILFYKGAIWNARGFWVGCGHTACQI